MRALILAAAVWSLSTVVSAQFAELPPPKKGPPPPPQQYVVDVADLGEDHEEAAAFGITGYDMVQSSTAGGGTKYVVKLLPAGQGTVTLNVADPWTWDAAVRRNGETVKVRLAGSVLSIGAGGASGSAKADPNKGWLKTPAWNRLMANLSTNQLESVKLAALVQTLQRQDGPEEESTCAASASARAGSTAAAFMAAAAPKPPHCQGQRCMASQIWGLKSECRRRAEIEAGRCCSNGLCFGCCHFEHDRPEGQCALGDAYLCFCTSIGYACDQRPAS